MQILKPSEFDLVLLSAILYIRFSFHIFDERESFSVKETKEIVDESLANTANVRKKIEL